MKVQTLDMLFAVKAINLVSGLKNSDREIAGAILDHYNRVTGQCDPSLDRIAKLLSISRRTVIRSISRIEAAGLFIRRRHGGHLNRNSYEPNWQRFHEIEAAWSLQKKANSQARRTTNVSPDTCQPCHIDSDRPVTQTCRSNL